MDFLEYSELNDDFKLYYDTAANCWVVSDKKKEIMLLRVKILKKLLNLSMKLFVFIENIIAKTKHAKITT